MTHLSMEALLSLREAGQEPGDASAREHLAACAACRAEQDRLDQRVAQRGTAGPRWPPASRPSAGCAGSGSAR